MMECTPESTLPILGALSSVALNKAEGYRGLTQHGGPPGRLEESDPTECDFVRDGPALMDHTTCPGLGLIYYLLYTKHRHELRHARKAWPGSV